MHSCICLSTCPPSVHVSSPVQALEKLTATQLQRLEEVEGLKASMAGHLNHKQKIHLHEQIKEENMALQREKVELRKEMKAAMQVGCTYGQTKY